MNKPVRRSAAADGCFHCGLPLPAGAPIEFVISGASQQFCCVGCQAVASAIVSGGLESFYRFRSADSGRPDQRPDGDADLAVWDLAELADEYLQHNEDGTVSANLAVDGITCAACNWLIEKHLGELPGVLAVAVNGTTHRAQLRWQPAQAAFSTLLAALRAIGYQATPLSPFARDKTSDQPLKTMLLRLGVAGLAMMQAGMVAIALYAGGYQDIDPHWQQLLRWLSWALVTPVVFYSALPFYRAAWRALRLGQLVMDLPVSLAIVLAYAASCYATLRGGGEVYYDSVSMFCFFLLLGRFVEARLRYRNLLALYSADELLPPTAVRVAADGQQQSVTLRQLVLGDRVRVYPGQAIPCDGVVVAGSGSVEEALLTGEAAPQPKRVGDSVSAGTLNGDNPLLIELSAVGQQTQLAAIMRIAEQAAADKPAWVAQADRLAGRFVAAVLLCAAAVMLYWSLWAAQPSLEHGFWVALSVLVVTCPCALSLATPTALAVAAGELRRDGLLVTNRHCLERMAAVSSVVFDKTGTLTSGQLELVACHALTALPPANESQPDELQPLAIAVALEQGGRHPVAEALRRAMGAGDTTALVAEQQFVAGAGVSGTVAGIAYALGRADWLADRFGLAPPVAGAGTAAVSSQVWLAANAGWLARFEFSDQLRSSAPAAVAALRADHQQLAVLSGDPSPQAAALLAPLAIVDQQFGQRPEQKLQQLCSRQQRGEVVAMVGDGINDVPVLRCADVSIAMGRAADLTQLAADALLLGNDLQTLPRALRLARRTRRIIGQNIGWAIGYNLLALPLAAAGFVPPWAAAIGMSSSSLIVLLNALRLRRRDLNG